VGGKEKKTPRHRGVTLASVDLPLSARHRRGTCGGKRKKRVAQGGRTVFQGLPAAESFFVLLRLAFVFDAFRGKEEEKPMRSGPRARLSPRPLFWRSLLQKKKKGGPIVGPGDVAQLLRPPFLFERICKAIHQKKERRGESASAGANDVQWTLRIKRVSSHTGSARRGEREGKGEKILEIRFTRPAFAAQWRTYTVFPFLVSPIVVSPCGRKRKRKRRKKRTAPGAVTSNATPLFSEQRR